MPLASSGAQPADGGLGLIWLVFVASALASCDLATLRASIALAEDAFVELDTEGFARAATDAGYTLSCLEEPLTPLDAAGYHRMKALKAFVDGSPEDATLAFQAVYASQPGYTLPTEMAPIGHPLRAAFDAALELAEPGAFLLPRPAAGWVSVDGRRTRTAPDGRPWLFQLFGDDSQVESVAWIPAGDSWPQYDMTVRTPTVTPQGPPAAVTSPPPEQPRDPIAAALRGSGIGLGVASLAAYGGAFAARNQYEGAIFKGDNDKIRNLHALTNGLTVGAIAGAGVSITLVVAGSL